MFRSRFIIALVAVAVQVGIARAQNTYYVDAGCGDDAWAGIDPDCVAPDGPKATIQAAIAAAVAGDTVVLAPGIYVGPGNRDLNLQGKPIVVRSEQPDNVGVVHATVIDCQGSASDPHRAFLFVSGEEGTSVVDGLTMINGWAPLESIGGGFRSVGGAIHFANASSPTIRRCVLRSNYALGDDPIHFGGFGGGAISCLMSDPLIEHCWIVDNASGDDGGGVYCYSSSPTLLACVIAGNDVGDSGGGVYCRAGGAPQLRSCLIHGNRADTGFDQRGGGVFCRDGANVVIENCTLCQNAAQVGGGLRVFNATATVRSCILWYNTASESAPQIGIGGVSGSASVTYSNVEGCYWTDEGDLCSDPLFADPDGIDDDILTWEDNDYHLTGGSDCINAGDPAFVLGPWEMDLDGHSRLLCARADMGAYEFGIGDSDCDQDVDLDDFGSWAICMTGPSDGPYPTGCEALDFDFDGDVDLADFGQFQLLFAGSQP